MKWIKMTCKRINRRLLPMKLVMFGWFGASACALPFMTVHMKELGLSVEETAIVYTLLPITQFLSSPIAGFIADRLGKYRDVLLVSILMTIVLATALLYVPPVNTPPFARISCDGKSMILEQCLVDNSTVLRVNDCHVGCQKITKIKSYTWDMTVHLKKRTNSSLCGYAVSSVRHDNKSSDSMCDSSTDPTCIVKCVQITNLSSGNHSGNGKYLTFWLYSVLRIVYNIFSAIGFTLVNSSALALTETDTEMGEYGRQRFWAMLSMAIFSPLAGVLVDVVSDVQGHLNYAPAFHTHNLLALLTGIAVWYLDFEMEDAPSSYMETFKNFWLLIKSPSITFLLLVVFWLGTMWGFLESFLFWFMMELGSPTYMMGLTVTVGSLVGLPFLHYARLIVSKVGHAGLLSVALFMYAIRFIGCSFLVDPWWIMPFETLEIFTFHLMWVAAATYAAHLSPPGLLATIQGFIEGVHYGVGQGSGSIIGGSLMSMYGSRSAFQVMGATSGVLAIIYGVLHVSWLRKRNVKPKSRRASVKSTHSQKLGRKSSTMSCTEANGSNPPASATPATDFETAAQAVNIPLT